MPVSVRSLKVKIPPVGVVMQQISSANRVSDNPLVSLILCVKNGMPYIKEALASVAAQTYRNFEFLVQDGCSTDGSLEYLRSLTTIPNVKIESRVDGGIGQAMNRAQQRCRGEIIAEIDCDNLMEPHALETVVKRFKEHPDAAVIYCGQKMIDARGEVLSVWHPEDFDLLRVMECALVPPYGSSYLHRANLGTEYRTEESMYSSSDFDFWLRVGHLKIVRTGDVLGSTRLSSASATARVEEYHQFCRDKISALERYFATRVPQFPFNESLKKRCRAGIYLWAAASVRFMCRSEQSATLFAHFCELARCEDPHSDRLQTLLAKAKEEEDRAAHFAETKQLAPVDRTPRVVLNYPSNELPAVLERSIYGTSTLPPLILEEESVVFRPTTDRDHLATPFNQTGLVGPEDSLCLEFEFAARSSANEFAQIQIQDQNMGSIGTILPTGKRLVQRIIVPKQSLNAVRLIFSGTAGKAALLPMRTSVVVKPGEGAPT